MVLPLVIGRAGGLDHPARSLLFLPSPGFTPASSWVPSVPSAIVATLRKISRKFRRPAKSFAKVSQALRNFSDENFAGTL